MSESADSDSGAFAEVDDRARAAKAAARQLATIGTAAKNHALAAMSDALSARRAEILDANGRDLSVARDKGVAPHMMDRLALNERRIDDMRDGLAQLIALPDPVGNVIAGWRRPNGLQINKVRVPLGVIGIIYESRPNVTVDAASLCLKAGNAVVLRGGSEAIHSNTMLTHVIAEAADAAGMPAGSIALIENTDRAAARRLMRLNGLVDCLIPRGGRSLIEAVVKDATVPVIETGTGNCHVYVHESADYRKSIDIVVNAKCSRPSVCNSAETLLLHEQMVTEWGGEFMVELFATLIENGVELRVDDRIFEIASQYPAFADRLKHASEEDFYTEFNDLILAVKVVDTLDEAIDHINTYGTQHSEAIVTEDYRAAQRFVDGVDAAAVYVNASTRFTDGGEFGFGAEIGISNQKLHARGPMGLEELTTIKYVVRGDGQVR
jgi:glutamate-5-semialdehyde dehydrogenase